MNKIEDVAKLLGVELNEYFTVLDEKGANIGEFCFDEIGFSNANVLLNILEGTYTMVKKPHKPKNGEVYYFLSPDSNFNLQVGKRTFQNHTIDYIYYKAGNAFRSVDEAKRQSDTLFHDLIEYYEGEEKK